MQQTRQKPMREVMPLCTEFVDAMRDAGLTDNATIAAGLKSGSCWFREGEHYIGKEGAPEASDKMRAMYAVQTCITTKAEREYINTVRAKGARK